MTLWISISTMAIRKVNENFTLSLRKVFSFERDVMVEQLIEIIDCIGDVNYVIASL